MNLDLLFVGTGGSAPTARRGLPSTLVRRGGEHVLVDCGEGTQRQLMRAGGLVELDLVLLTHLHADHWLGLPGMLKTFDLRERSAPLTVAGPEGTARALGDLLRITGGVRYPLEILELAGGAQLRRDGWTVHALDVEHRTRARGYALVEDVRPGRFDPDAARALGVTEPRDFGRLQRGETVGAVRPEQVMGEARLGRKVVLSGDTRPCDAIRLAAHGADVLVHEATFTSVERARARKTGHSTAAQAAELAAEAGVRLLALTHLSARHRPSEALEEARAIHAGTVLPRDFDVVEIPFPERGTPELRPGAGRTRAPAGGAGGLDDPDAEPRDG
ncbi:ribonuclease Z [Patulibacter brassicae]|uniref:Ribonuclease Z n=1 Tax=Patulibacter brassicae TaxID=1705717 RepID=A0ABU4VE12_9ACTN|nr:ribonuclease Z [Patulibacter brassicae]MDX8150042.1 ribonuclease Z [Patulibacter brassicae]